MNDLISVIVPVYNAEEFLPLCLDCLSHQTYSNLEIILVNDGSTDRSGDICEEFARNDSRCRVIHQKNQGQWWARKAGQEVSSGRYLIFIDADDCFRCDMISLLHDAISTDERFGFAMADMASVDQIPNNLFSQIPTPPPCTLSPETLMLGLCDRPRYPDKGYGYIWNKMFRRELIEELRTRDYPRCPDMDFVIRATCRAVAVVHVPVTLYYWVQRPGSLTHTANVRNLQFYSKANIYLDNFRDSELSNGQYSDLFLKALFRTVQRWVACLNKKDRNNNVLLNEVLGQINGLKKQYLFCQSIPFFERLSVLFLLKFPACTLLLTKITSRLIQW